MRLKFQKQSELKLASRIILGAKRRRIVRLVENESRRVGMKFETLVELSPKRSGAG